MTATLADSQTTRTARIGHGPAFWVVAAGFLVAMAFATVPAPLYVIYQARDGFSSFTVTVIFAAYAVGVVLSLFLAGHLSDLYGRRRVLLPALWLNVVSALVFIFWQSLPGLLVGRLLSGLAVGAITATATAYLAELHATARPGRSRSRADVVGIAANLGGLGLGQLIAGVLAEWAPEPLHTSYVLFLVLLVAAAVATRLIPETAQLPARPPRYRPQRMSVPRAARAEYAAVCAAAFAALAMTGFFTSLAPQFIAGTLHHPSRALAGLIGFLVLAAAAIAQVLVGSLPVRRQLALGFVALAAGAVVVTAAVLVPSLWVFVLGSLLSGAGSGMLLRGAIATVASVSAPESRGEALAGMFLVGYVGLTVPVLGLGIATQVFSTGVAVAAFAALLLAVIAGAARFALVRRG